MEYTRVPRDRYGLANLISRGPIDPGNKDAETVSEHQRVW